MQRAASVARNPGRFTVAASPFNRIKLELGVLLLCIPLVWLVSVRLGGGDAAQLVLLGAYGCMAMGWVMFRVRRLLRRLGPLAGGADDGA